MCILRQNIASDERIDTFYKIPNFCDFAILFPNSKILRREKFPIVQVPDPFPFGEKNRCLLLNQNLSVWTFCTLYGIMSSRPEFWLSEICPNEQLDIICHMWVAVSLPSMEGLLDRAINLGPFEPDWILCKFLYFRSFAVPVLYHVYTL